MKRNAMKVGFKVAMGGLTMALLASVLGCVEGKTPEEKFHSRMRADPVPVSDFLPDHDLLVRQPNTFPFHYFYLKEQSKAYEYVRIAPVDISKLRSSNSWNEFDKALAGKLGTRVEDLANFMKKAYEQSFRNVASSSNLEVTDRTNLPKTLVIEPALIALVPTKAELNALGVAANFVVPGLGIVSSAMFGGGSITVECRVRDAATGELVAMYADTETEPKAVIQASQFSWTYSARINIKQIAEDTARVLSAKDYREIRRKFPIRWTSLIKDGELGEEKK